jgi:trehalose/maltose hydrolase-like predicted phosphorylase
VLKTSISDKDLCPYIGSGGTGTFFDPSIPGWDCIKAGDYVNGALIRKASMRDSVQGKKTGASGSLDLRTGFFYFADKGITMIGDGRIWADIWKKSDIEIAGDPEAQQVTHANLFYLLGSLQPKSNNSIPPMGLSSLIYSGHIFWDAEIWMFPAFVAQHPEWAKSIVNYRFKLLDQAKKNAAAHGFKGAEYPWESAATGKEEAPGEFSKERHITADVAIAAWQYYLWSGDKKYLATEAWPILEASADYWTSRAKKGSDGKYHIKDVIGPDESAGAIDDDAWTNGAVQYNMTASCDAAKILGKTAPGAWTDLGSKLALAFDSKANRYLEYDKAPESLQAKQANTQMLIYPLDEHMSDQTAGATLDYALSHTIKVGPAMTSSINAIVAAKLGRAQQSLDLFRDSYRPFMRTGLCMFSEKRTMNRVDFCTGMGGCVQSVLYGFGGLNVAWGDHKGKGILIAKSADSSLYADPHLPPSWSGLTIHGVKFHGASYTVAIDAQSKAVARKE